MSFATNNLCPKKLSGALKRFFFTALLVVLTGARSFAYDTNQFVVYAQRIFLATQARHQADPTNAEAACRFARACFDRAEFSSNSAQRADLAEKGIAVCRSLLARETNSAAGHYLLGMNLGQLARTKFLGALRIVDEMEREFKIASELDEHLDYAGPERNLGLLYLNAPSIGSIGSRKKARFYLQLAVRLAPNFPENRLNLAETYLQWREYNAAQHELDMLEQTLSQARQEFTGEKWAASWWDWDNRIKVIKHKLNETPVVSSPRGKND